MLRAWTGGTSAAATDEFRDHECRPHPGSLILRPSRWHEGHDQTWLYDPHDSGRDHAEERNRQNRRRDRDE